LKLPLPKLFAPLRWMIQRKRRPIFDGLCEELQQITFIIAIDEDPSALNAFSSSSM